VNVGVQTLMANTVKGMIQNALRLATKISFTNVEMDGEILSTKYRTEIPL